MRNKRKGYQPIISLSHPNGNLECVMWNFELLMPTAFQLLTPNYFPLVSDRWFHIHIWMFFSVFL